MDYSAAFAKFSAHCPPDQDPVLSANQQDAAMREAAAVDEDGYAPSDEDWTPTYSTMGVVRAVVRGWEMKAANAAGRFDFTTDGQTFRRSQVIANCNAQADMHRRKLSGHTTANAST